MNYDFACLWVSQIVQYIAFFPSRETSETLTDIFARSESHFPQHSREKICETRLAVNLTHNTGLLIPKTTLVGIFSRIKRKIVKFFFTSSFFVFAIFVFRETCFIRNLGSFAKLQNSENSSLGLKRKCFFKFSRKAKIKRNFGKLSEISLHENFSFLQKFSRKFAIFANIYKINIKLWKNFMFL